MTLNMPENKQSAVYQQNQINRARSNLLVVVVFTVLNVVLLLIGSNRYFLFSATIPYYLTFFGYMFDYYTVGTYTLTGLTMAVLPVAAMALCWFMSKKDSRWLKGAVAVFGLDTAAMVALLIWSGDASGVIIDIVFHGWVLYSLVCGVKADSRLKAIEAQKAAMPEEPDSEENSEEIPTEPEVEPLETESEAVDTDCPV